MGNCLSRTEGSGFDLLLTTDKNVRYQQNLAGRKIAIVVISRQQWPQLRPHIQRVTEAVDNAAPGSFVEVDIPYLLLAGFARVSLELARFAKDVPLYSAALPVSHLPCRIRLSAARLAPSLFTRSLAARRSVTPPCLVNINYARGMPSSSIRRSLIDFPRTGELRRETLRGQKSAECLSSPNSAGNRDRPRKSSNCY